MRIKNEYREKIYWRAFRDNDAAYVVGLHQGHVHPGQIGQWREDSFPDIKVEVKTGDIVFSKAVLARAGQIFSMEDDLVVDQDGQLSVAKPTFMPAEPEKIKVTDVQFIDTRKFDREMTREVTFSLQKSFSATQEIQRTHEREQTWTVGDKIGGTIGEKDVASASREVSAQFQKRVVDTLTQKYEKQVNAVWEWALKDTFTFRPGKIYAVTVNWTIELETGLASYFGEKVGYSVLSNASGSLTVAHAFDSEDEMDPSLQKKYEQLEKA